MMHRELKSRPWRQRRTDAPVAWTPATASTTASTIDLEHWHSRIGAWQALLAAHARPGASWILYEPDPLEFSAALVAIWERSDRVILPADSQPATRTALMADGVALGQLPGAPKVGRARAPEWTDTPLPDIAVTLYTSGSTGEPQRLDKRFAQLDAELATQARLWPYAGRVVISQVSHQHIYGLLFAILRPLCEEAPLADRACQYPETLRAWLETCRDSGREAALISAPPALSRLPEALDWSCVSPALTRIHSSGAPLAREASDAMRDALDCDVHEIYGSSETGGIAWRVQQQGPAWTPLPGVEVRADDEGRLWLRSPHLATPDTWQRQADRIQRHPMPDAAAAEPPGDSRQRFVLLGRADRIVKIGGKRLSLTAMDRELSALPGVRRAQTLTLERRDLRLAAIVELEADALPHDHAAHRRVVRRLREALATRFETPMLPRYWRFVGEWPSNAQGKLSAELRQRLFQDLEDRRAPRWLGERRLENGWQLTLEIPEHCAFLDGHFDTQPVLPGITLVHWAMRAARRLMAVEGDFHGLDRLRFPSPLLPGDRFTLTLTWANAAARATARQTLTIHCESPRGTHASGRVTLASEVAHVE